MPLVVHHEVCIFLRISVQLESSMALIRNNNVTVAVLTVTFTKKFRYNRNIVRSDVLHLTKSNINRFEVIDE